MTDLARKRSRTFTTLCVNVDFKDNPDRNRRNRLLEFDTDSTWMEVLEDTLEEGNVDVGIRKTDTVTVNLTSKMSTDVFHPSLDDAIDAALCFDKTLRYVTFNVSSFENKDIYSNIAKPTGPVSVSAFDVLMGAAKAPAVVKLPTVKDPRHTGIVYHSVVGVSLQGGLK
jgi:hypothetical protein